ncbi:cell division protein FtsL [Leeia sp. TBRC 13508]|uniref:Cell division protein FtsL n=1 Tax=Leeia speluncae TaxID=2884804 RepID=A0ABS8D5J7_9NEIS|nr:cell division protein FtsL [Leeia speluncae]MCB6183490.1 cell division protein FtsL [Leeia speluncae]
MFKLNLLLLVVAIVSALSVVTSQHKARRLYAAYEQEEKMRRQYGEDYDKLLLEQSTQGMHSRIEKEAQGALKMNAPTPERTRVVTSGGDAVLVIPPKEE